MYFAPSASQTCAPLPRVKKRGVPPTARKARTGEFTPPGVTFWARSKSSTFRVIEERSETRSSGFHIGRPEERRDHRQCIGAGVEQRLAVFDRDAADGDHRHA